MADSNQPASQAASSYSDPIYDRLEHVLFEIGHRWRIIAIGLLLATVAVLMFRFFTQRSPDADSAARFMEARGKDFAALRLLMDQKDVTPEFRAQAALEAASQLLQDGPQGPDKEEKPEEKVKKERERAEEALQILDQGVVFAREAGNPNLVLAIGSSKGHVLEALGKPAEAMTIYQEVESKGIETPADPKDLGRNLGQVYRMAATLGIARCHLALSESKEAEAKDQPAAAEDLRRQAQEHRTAAADLLNDISTNRKAVGSQDLETLAGYQLEVLRLRHPELRKPLSVVIPSTPRDAAQPQPDVKTTSPSEAKPAIPEAKPEAKPGDPSATPKPQEPEQKKTSTAVIQQ